MSTTSASTTWISEALSAGCPAAKRLISKAHQRTGACSPPGADQRAKCARFRRIQILGQAYEHPLVPFPCDSGCTLVWAVWACVGEKMPAVQQQDTISIAQYAVALYWIPSCPVSCPWLRIGPYAGRRLQIPAFANVLPHTYGLIPLHPHSIR